MGIRAIEVGEVCGGWESVKGDFLEASTMAGNETPSETAGGAVR